MANQWVPVSSANDWLNQANKQYDEPYVAGTSSTAPTLGSGVSDLGSGTGTKTTKEGKDDTKDAEREERKRLDKLRDSIGDQFDDILGNYSSQIKGLPGEQQSILSGVGTLADTQKGTINSALATALQQLEGNRGEVKTQQKATLQDLADNTRNLFQAGNIYLGSRGAGDSSATGMYSAALTNQANKQRGDVQGQVNSMMTDINNQQVETEGVNTQMLNEVDTWKANQEQQIVMQYTDLKRQLETAMASAKGQEKANLADLEAQLYNQARTQLTNLQNQAATAKASSVSNYQNTGGGLGQAGADRLKMVSQEPDGGYVINNPATGEDIKIMSAGNGNYSDVNGNMYGLNAEGDFSPIQQAVQGAGSSLTQ